MLHGDTYGISKPVPNAIPFVSDAIRGRKYYRGMAKDDAWTDWPIRYRNHVKEKGVRWATIAERMDTTEAGIRHWLNGTRQINLTDFFNLCDAADADPAIVLFGPGKLSDAQRKRLGAVVTSILEADTTANADYGELITHLSKNKPRK